MQHNITRTPRQISAVTWQGAQLASSPFQRIECWHKIGCLCSRWRRYRYWSINQSNAGIRGVATAAASQSLTPRNTQASKVLLCADLPCSAAPVSAAAAKLNCRKSNQMGQWQLFKPPYTLNAKDVVFFACLLASVNRHSAGLHACRVSCSHHGGIHWFGGGSVVQVHITAPVAEQQRGTLVALLYWHTLTRCGI